MLLCQHGPSFLAFHVSCSVFLLLSYFLVHFGNIVIHIHVASVVLVIIVVHNLDHFL